MSGSSLAAAAREGTAAFFLTPDGEIYIECYEHGDPDIEAFQMFVAVGDPVPGDPLNRLTALLGRSLPRTCRG